MNAKKAARKILCCALVMSAAISLIQAQAPTHTGRLTPVIDASINGFYEYLPRNYATDVNTKYPLLVFCHAAGECGSVPDMATLDKVKTWGPPQLINNAVFPDSFSTGGQWYKFIVISPQLKEGLTWTTPANPTSPSTINDVIEYAKAAYRVDVNRIYLCGMSLGGAGTFHYAGSSATAANQLAAIVVACSAGDLSTTEANTIAAANLPVLATHNKGDTIVSYLRTEANVNLINAYTPAITPRPRLVEWEGGDHNVWSRTYEDINPGITSQGLTGNLRDTLGINVYEWMLQFTRLGSTLPLVWQSFTVKEINASPVLRWSITKQVNNLSYTIEKSNDGTGWSAIATLPAQKNEDDTQKYQYTDPAIFQPACFYRIRQTDLDGAYSYSTVQKFVPTDQKRMVKIFPNPFSEQIVIQVAGIIQKKINVKLINAGGQILVKEQHVINNSNDMITVGNVKNLDKGYYAIIIEDETGSNILRTLLLKE
ncbi:MAG TPA: T9SS type A sorting domain-containing protein [Chitinophagaceae bacterium]|nr:T9SS type A sorting domain-containing protein [Chitinophagaceae bacterium]